MTSATEELRCLLDERGVEWWVGDDERKTLWESNGLTWEYFNNENADAWLGFLGVCEQDVTPEQAITATLGEDKSNAEHTCTMTKDFRCSECGELLGTVRNYEMYETDDGKQDWRLLGHEVCDHSSHCPHCNAKVVETMTSANDKKLIATIEALTALASALSWMQPSNAASVNSYLKDAWVAIDKLKE